jgi:CBS domain-containing protein
MQVREVMTRGVECIAPETTLQEAAAKMRELDTGCLPVCENNRLAGMVTDRDIVIRAIAEGRDPRTCTARDVMTREIVCCFEDDDIEEAARLMKDRQIRRLMVLNRNKRLAGIVSLGDLAVDTGDDQFSGEILERVSKRGLWNQVPLATPY